jgi:hypothetical protein
MRARVLGGVAVVVSTAVLSVLPTPPAAAGARDICGTVLASDGRYVRATVGVLLFAGNTVLDLDGGGGHSIEDVEVNPDLLSDQGVVPGSAEDTGQYEDTFCFEGIDPNVTHHQLEVLPRGADGATSWARYGGASRARATLPAVGQAGITLRLPLQCDVGGDTGSLRVQAYSNGSPTTIGRVRAVGEGPSPTTGRQGFAQVDDGSAGPASPVLITGLEPNTRYWVEVVFAGRQRRSTFAEVAVRPCETTTIRAWTGAKPAGTPARWTSRPQTVNGTYLPVAGDFTGDGRTDIFWYAAGSPMDYLWEATPNGSTFTSRPFPVNGVYRPTAGDFDGDGVDDLFFFAPGAAADHMWYFDAGGQSYTSQQVSAWAFPTTQVHSGDFDGNGVDDVLFFTPVGPDSIWRHAPGGARTSASIAIGANSNVVVGDVDGDLRDDVLQHNTLSGTVRLFFGTAAGGFTQATQGAARLHLPVMGDFTCDLRADVILYRPGPGADVMWRGRAKTAPVFTAGTGPVSIRGSYLHQVVGDFDGNGCDDVFWYQPGTTRDSIWLNSAVGWNLPRSTTSGSF